jgi:class III poly(R)-hydroxyalkanoic acid synthase PhaE subunit
MDNVQNYMKTWLSAQEKIVSGFIETSKRTQEMLTNQQHPAFSDVMGGGDHAYSSWMAAVQKSLSETGDFNHILKDYAARLFGSSNAYTKLTEIWLPLMKAAQQRALNPDSYKDYLDPTKYQEVMDSVFGFDSEANQLMLTQAVQFLELFTGSGNQFSNPWIEATKASMGALPQIIQGHPASIIGIFHSLFKAFDNTVGRAFHVPPVGKDREKFELILRCLDDLSVYSAKNIEYQHTLYTTGFTALEKVVERVAEKISAGEEIKQYDEFFDVWIDTNEHAYFELFQTDRFSKLQGELLDASLKLRAHFFTVMEIHFTDLPIALRSEMDDLYKTVYDLKKTVRQLERKLNEEAV